MWSFSNYYARNVIISGAYNSSSSHADNRKNKFLVLNEGDTFGINGSFGTPEKSFNINFSKEKAKLWLSLHYKSDNSYLLVTRKEVFKFKASNGNINFPDQFYPGSISNEFGAAGSREVSLGGNVYDFSVKYNSIDKLSKLDIHKHLMVKNNIK